MEEVIKIAHKNYEKITGNYDGENNGVFRPFEAVIYKVRNAGNQ